MVWELIEKPAGITRTFTDEEMFKICTYLKQVSEPGINQKLEQVILVADHNAHQLHEWENEGGKCNDNKPQKAKQKLSGELSLIHDTTDVKRKNN